MVTPYPALAPFRPLELQAPSEKRTTCEGVVATVTAAVERGGLGGGLMEADGDGRLGGRVAGAANDGGLAGVL